MAVDPRWKSNQKVHRAASSSANDLVPALADIVRSGDWREFEHPSRGVQHYDSLPVYCEQFLGMHVDAVRSLLERSNFASDARLVLAEIPAAAKHGGKRDQGRITTLPSTDTVPAVVARLKRDRPDLAQQVIDGTLTPNAAAIRAGFRHPRVSVRTDDPTSAIQVLLKHFDRQALIDALSHATTVPSMSRNDQE